MTVEGAPATSADPPSDTDLLTSKFAPSSPAIGITERPRLLEARLRGVGEAAHARRRAGRLRKDHRARGLVPRTSAEPRTRSSPGCRWSAPRTTRLCSGAMSSAPCAGAGSTGGANAEAILRVPGADVGAAVRSLLNDLAAADQRIVLILDDYHVVDEPACHELVADLLEHLPAGVRLVIATRSDPPLPLASLRVAGQLAEIRADDLRLTPEEAASFVRVTEGLPLDDAELALLTARTEGWVAAIHLAVLWLRAQPDQRAALLAVRRRQQAPRRLSRRAGPRGARPEVERFLLQTSILTRFCAPLCDAVTDQRGAAESLAGIERANLFLVPLDGRRQWYRYHHLFGGLLQAELGNRDPDLVPVLHRRAYAWHREHGTVTEAVHHATLAGDYSAAADAITASWITLIRSGRSATVQRWLRRFPDGRPRACSRARLRRRLRRRARRWNRDRGGPLAADRRDGGRRTPSRSGRMVDGTTSYEVNVNVIRAAFVYRDVGAAVAIAQRVADAESHGGQWRVPALAALGVPAGTSRAKPTPPAPPSTRRWATAMPRRDRMASSTRWRPSACSSSTTGTPRGRAARLNGPWTSARPSASPTASPRGLPTWPAGAASSPSVVRRRASRELEIATGLLEGRAPIAHHLYALLVLAEARRAAGDLVGAHRSADAAELADRVLRRCRDLSRDARRAAGAVAAPAQAPPGGAWRRAVGVGARRPAAARRGRVAARDRRRAAAFPRTRSRRTSRRSIASSASARGRTPCARQTS